MSEPKWWPIGEVPTEPGWYQSHIDGGGGRGGWKFPEETAAANAGDYKPRRQFYGPILEPPKEPMRLRRFTATRTSSGERISGSVPVNYCDGTSFIAYSHSGGAGVFCIRNVSDIKFIDEE